MIFLDGIVFYQLTWQQALKYDISFGRGEDLGLIGLMVQIQSLAACVTLKYVSWTVLTLGIWLEYGVPTSNNNECALCSII